jgi:hypothetical protein
LIYIKIHNTESGRIVAMCDESVIGKIIEEEDVEIDLKTYSDFYKGRLVGPEGVPSINELEDMSSANIVGKESVAIAIDKGIIGERSVRIVCGVPFAQAFRIKV